MKQFAIFDNPQLISIVGDRMRPFHSAMLLLTLFSTLILLSYFGLEYCPSVSKKIESQSNCGVEYLSREQPCGYYNFSNNNSFKSYYGINEIEDKSLYITVEPVGIKRELIKDEKKSLVGFGINYNLKFTKISEKSNTNDTVLLNETNVKVNFQCYYPTTECLPFELIYQSKLSTGLYLLEFEFDSPPNTSNLIKHNVGFKFHSFSNNIAFGLYEASLRYGLFLITLVLMIRFMFLMLKFELYEMAFEQKYCIIMCLVLLISDSPLAGVKISPLMMYM